MDDELDLMEDGGSGENDTNVANVTIIATTAAPPNDNDTITVKYQAGNETENISGIVNDQNTTEPPGTPFTKS
jgi:hypothetical protein